MQGKVLIIEDEEVLSLLFQQALIKELQEAEVETAGSGKVGLQKARTFQPDVIILDIMLPGESGWEVAQALKDDDSTRHIPIIISSGAGSPFDRKPFVAHELAEEYLRKPYDVETLCAAIQRVLTL